MFNVKLPSGRTFFSSAGQSLIEAAEAAGVTLPYSCRNGRCSTCRLRVRSGTTFIQKPEIGLTQQELAESWVLGCVREASSNVELDVEDMTGLSLPQPRTLPCRIDMIEDIAPDVRRIVLRLPPKSQFAFIPGQYAEIIGPNGLRRSYSFAAASNSQGQLELHVRRVLNGVMSDYWFEKARLNDLLRLHGPLGTFVLRDIAGQDLVFLATGTGIAPIRAMLQQIGRLAPELRPGETHVIWGGRVEADLYLDPRDAYPEAHYTATLSRAPASWDGCRMYVQDALIDTGKELNKAKVYACGSDGMIQSGQKSLTTAGLPPTSFYSDAFVCSS
jgi:CDP-4-dehydro-6-deoxyglucose reductase